MLRSNMEGNDPTAEGGFSTVRIEAGWETGGRGGFKGANHWILLPHSSSPGWAYITGPLVTGSTMATIQTPGTRDKVGLEWS